MMPNSRFDTIIDEAARQINARGISLTSISDLARPLGISRAAVYYYIKDREDLVFQVYQRSCATLMRHLQAAREAESGALETIVRFIRTILEDEGPELASMNELGLLSPDKRKAILGQYRNARHSLVELLESGHSAGEVRRCDFEVVALTLLSIVQWIPLASRWSVYREPPVRRKDIVDTFCQLLQTGWAAERETPIRPPTIDLDELVLGGINPFNREWMVEAKRQTILTAASRFFNERGIDATSMEDIAADIGTTKTVIYQNIGDKPALVSACYERAMRAVDHILGEAASFPGAKNVLVAVLRANAMALQREEFGLLRPVAISDSMNASDRAAWAARAVQMQHAYEALCSSAAREGTLRHSVDARLLLLIVTGQDAWLQKGMVGGTRLRKAAIAAEVVDVLRLGLAPLCTDD